MLTKEDVEATVVTAQYHSFQGTTMTACCLTLKNGYHVVGTSACIHPADFDENLGRKYAREEAVKKIFELEAYLIRQRITCFGK